MRFPRSIHCFFIREGTSTKEGFLRSGQQTTDNRAVRASCPSTKEALTVSSSYCSSLPLSSPKDCAASVCRALLLSTFAEDASRRARKRLGAYVSRLTCVSSAVLLLLGADNKLIYASRVFKLLLWCRAGSHQAAVRSGTRVLQGARGLRHDYHISRLKNLHTPLLALKCTKFLASGSAVRLTSNVRLHSPEYEFRPSSSRIRGAACPRPFRRAGPDARMAVSSRRRRGRNCRHASQ